MFTRNICARMLFVLLAAAAMIAAASSAQAQEESGISGPVLGFVFDTNAGAFRRVLGMPGAAMLSDSLSIAAPVHFAEIARDLALVTIGDEEAPAIIRLQDDASSFHLIDGALPAPSKIVLSPNGTAAALYYPEAGKLQIISELSASSSVNREISIHDGPAVAALAISDNAETVLLGRADADSGAVSMLASDGSESFLFGTTKPSAITFIGSSSDAVVSDSASSTVYVVRQGDTQVIGSDSDGLAAPKAVSVSNDGHWAFAVNSGGGTVIGLDLTGGPSHSFVCPCEAGGLHWLGQGSVFRLSNSSSPMWFLNAGRAESPLFFVPPAADSQATAGNQQNGDAL